MNIKVDIYSKHHGIYTVNIDDGDIEELAISKYLESSTSKEYTGVTIDEVKV